MDSFHRLWHISSVINILNLTKLFIFSIKKKTKVYIYNTSVKWTGYEGIFNQTAEGVIVNLTYFSVF